LSDVRLLRTVADARAFCAAARGHQPKSHADAKQSRLQQLAVLVPQVAPHSHQHGHGQDGQRHAVLGTDLGLGCLDVVAGLAGLG